MATTNTDSLEPAGDRVPATVIEDLLASPRRRVLLVWLHEEQAMPVDDLATKLAAWSKAGGDVRTSERRTARTEIYQEHLPKLTATGVVAFDSLLGRIELQDVPELTTRLERTRV